MNKNVKPIILCDENGNEKYTLEFNRRSVMKAEQSGFAISSIEDKVMSGLLELFFYAFQMHHAGITKQQTDAILDEMGGFPDGMIDRLAELYAVPYETLVQDEESAKNAKWAAKF